MSKRDKRFIKTYSESTFSSTSEIWVDKETGVNYLYHASGYSGGLTVMLKADGTPVVTPKSQLLER